MKFLKLFLGIILGLWMNQSAIGQPDTSWMKTFGGDDFEFGTDVLQTDDGSFLICGNTASLGAGELDVYLIKTNESGDTLWTKTFGGVWEEVGWSLQATDDGGYAIAGNTWSYGAGQNDMLLIKTDSTGDMEWMKTYGGNGSEWCRTMLNTNDGGYILVGSTEAYGTDHSDIYLVKTDESGDTVWTRSYGGYADEVGNWIQETSDNGYIICGFTTSYGLGSSDIYLLKINTAGDTLWTKTYGDSGQDIGNCVKETEDGGFIVLGITDSYGNGALDAYLIKLNAFGDSSWSQVYGGEENDEPIVIEELHDSGYIITGITESFGAGSGDVWLIRTNPSGDSLWTHTIGGVEFDEGASIKSTNEGGYIIVGTTESFGSISSDIFLIKLESDPVGFTDDLEHFIPQHFILHQNYPNPFNPLTMIHFQIPIACDVELGIYDLLGQKVTTLVNENRNAGHHHVEWDASGYASGVYYYRLSTSAGYVQTRKLIVLR